MSEANELPPHLTRGRSGLSARTTTALSPTIVRKMAMYPHAETRLMSHWVTDVIEVEPA